MEMDLLTKEELIKLCKTYAKNWLAHDGCWFLAAEEKHGMNEAVMLDKKAWERFTVAEAKRIIAEFDMPSEGGLDALEKALDRRLYAAVNKQSTERKDGKLIFKMNECRVQAARKRKGLPDFPCKEVGIVEYSGFASTIDPRIKTNCIACPPDKHPDEFYCAWEFELTA